MQPMLTSLIEIPLAKLLAEDKEAAVSSKSLYIMGSLKENADQIGELAARRIDLAAKMSTAMKRRSPIDFFITFEDASRKQPTDRLYGAQILRFLHAHYRTYGGVRMRFEPFIETTDGQRGLLPYDSVATGDIFTIDR
jgi:hypothetical protein